MSGNPPLFQFNEGTLPLDVPGEWEDHTLHILRLPGHGQATTSLVISHEQLPLGMDVVDYMRGEIARMRTTLPEFAVHGQVAINWSDTTGEMYLTRWRSPEGLMDQMSTCRRVNGRRLLIFTATHATPFPATSYQALLTAITGFVPRDAGEPAQIGTAR